MSYYTAKLLVTSRNIQGLQVLVPGAKYQLCKQALVSEAEVHKAPLRNRLDLHTRFWIFMLESPESVITLELILDWK